MSIREQLRGVIRRSRDMGDVGGDSDDDAYAVLDAERHTHGTSPTQRSSISPTGRSMQDLLREQQNQMRLAEERHRQEYLPVLDIAIRAVGGDPNAPHRSGGSGAASFSNTPSRSPTLRERSPSLRDVLSGEAAIPRTNSASTPRTSPRLNPMLNRTPTHSQQGTPETSPLAPSSAFRTHSPLEAVAATGANPTVHKPTAVNTNRPDQSGSSSAFDRSNTPPRPPMMGGGAATRSPSRGEGSPTLSYRSATPPPPRVLNNTPPPTPRLLQSSTGAGPTLDGTLASGASTLIDPELLEATQRPPTILSSSNAAPTHSPATAAATSSSQPPPPRQAMSGVSPTPPAVASPPSMPRRPSQSNVSASGSRRASASYGGGVIRAPSAGGTASVGGQGPSLSLREMMSDRNNDLRAAEKRREEEYIPLRDAAFREIEQLEAEGKWKRM